MSDNVHPFPAAKKASPSIADTLDEHARRGGVTTFSNYSHTNGGTLVWVSRGEADPVTALLKAAVSILVRRGQKIDNGPISIKKLRVYAPGEEFSWQVMDNDGAVLHSGFAGSEHEASEKIAALMTISLDASKRTT